MTLYPKKHIFTSGALFILVLMLIIPALFGQGCPKDQWIKLEIHGIVGIGAGQQGERVMGTFYFCPGKKDVQEVVIVAGYVRTKELKLTVSEKNTGNISGIVQIGEKNHTLCRYNINVNFTPPSSGNSHPATGIWHESHYNSVAQGGKLGGENNKTVTKVSITGPPGFTLNPPTNKQPTPPQNQPPSPPIQPAKGIFYCEILNIQTNFLDVQATGKAYGGSGNYSYSWDFGEGAPSPAAPATENYKYLCPGLYRIRLIVQDLTTHQECYCDKMITVSTPHFTTAGFIQATAVPGKYPDPFDDYYIEFEAPQPMGGVPPFQFHWDFGDNRNHIPDTLGTPITHFYWHEGIYTITLTITDFCNQKIPPLTKMITVKRLTTPPSLTPPSSSPDAWIGRWNTNSIYPNAPGPKTFPWWFEISKEKGKYVVNSHTTDRMEIISITSTSLKFRFHDMFQTSIEVVLLPDGMCKGIVDQPKNQPDYTHGIIEGKKQK
ncbi:PKD domain-containing protein [Acidobacteriota bacterium]